MARERKIALDLQREAASARGREAAAAMMRFSQMSEALRQARAREQRAQQGGGYGHSSDEEPIGAIEGPIHQ